MNERTRVFLNEFTTNLNRLFDIELATTYLTRMDSHLNQFYEDVNSELDQKEESLNDAIEGKRGRKHGNHSQNKIIFFLKNRIDQ